MPGSRNTDRMTKVTGAGLSSYASYDYLSNSRLVEQISVKAAMPPTFATVEYG
jgi:hypothetical protein